LALKIVLRGIRADIPSELLKWLSKWGLDNRFERGDTFLKLNQIWLSGRTIPDTVQRLTEEILNDERNYGIRFYRRVKREEEGNSQDRSHASKTKASEV
jgi:hypothetical protein